MEGRPLPTDRSADSLAPRAAGQMVKCPKCGADAREIARFCPRCHATLRYRCPACGHEQRDGVTCQHCGIQFIKYINALVAQKRAEADVVHDRIERRSQLLKNILWAPVTGGLSLLRFFLVSHDSKRDS
jgi:predicted RNA-binding Zn-ribbon protein involved in translation (DUF1610 family)